MTGDTIQPPISFPERQDPLDLSHVCEAAGLPAEYLTDALLKEHVVPSIAATFGNYEFGMQHGAIEDPELRQQFGDQSYDQGTFGQRLRALLEGNDIALHSEADSLIRYAASACARDVVMGGVAVPRHNVIIHTRPGLTPKECEQETLLSQTLNYEPRDLIGEEISRQRPPRDITKTALELDGRIVTLERTPQIVVDYSPGLHSISYIKGQLDDMLEKRLTYSYLAIGKGAFINEFLMQYWSAKLNGNPRLLHQAIGKYYIGCEDGIVAATDRYIAVQGQHTGSPVFSDLVLATGIHAASYDEVRIGIANAYRILQPQGTLLLCAPKAISTRGHNNVPIETMVHMSLEAGFDWSKAQGFDTTTPDSTGRPVEGYWVMFRK